MGPPIPKSSEETIKKSKNLGRVEKAKKRKSTLISWRKLFLNKEVKRLMQLWHSSSCLPTRTEPRGRNAHVQLGKHKPLDSDRVKLFEEALREELKHFSGASQKLSQKAATPSKVVRDQVDSTRVMEAASNKLCIVSVFTDYNYMLFIMLGADKSMETEKQEKHTAFGNTITGKNVRAVDAKSTFSSGVAEVQAIEGIILERCHFNWLGARYMIRQYQSVVKACLRERHLLFEVPNHFDLFNAFAHDKNVRKAAEDRKIITFKEAPPKNVEGLEDFRQAFQRGVHYWAIELYLIAVDQVLHRDLLLDFQSMVGEEIEKRIANGDKKKRPEEYKEEKRHHPVRFYFVDRAHIKTLMKTPRWPKEYDHFSRGSKDYFDISCTRQSCDNRSKMVKIELDVFLKSRGFEPGFQLWSRIHYQAPHDRKTQ